MPWRCCVGDRWPTARASHARRRCPWTGQPTGWPLAVLDDYAGRLAKIVDEESPDLSEFLDVSHRYMYFVGPREPSAADMYKRLVSALWRQAIADMTGGTSSLSTTLSSARPAGPAMSAAPGS